MLSRRNLSQSSTGSGVGTPMRMKILTRAVRSQTWRAPLGPGLCLGRWMTGRGTRRMRLVPTFGGGGSGTTTLTWRYSLFRGILCGRQEGRRKAGPTCFFKLRCLWRTLPNTDAKLAEAEAEVTLLEEDFAKALKQQILL